MKGNIKRDNIHQSQLSTLRAEKEREENRATDFSYSGQRDGSDQVWKISERPPNLTLMHEPAGAVGRELFCANIKGDLGTQGQIHLQMTGNSRKKPLSGIPQSSYDWQLGRRQAREKQRVFTMTAKCGGTTGPTPRTIKWALI